MTPKVRTRRTPAKRNVASMRRALLSFYDGGHRDLPWRRTDDPYAIWVSEIMLQQTQVATAERYYQRFLDRFPTVATLAQANEGTVCEAWAGLGYYRRARSLHAAAQRVVSEHHGTLPKSVSELRKLPGIGRYTAGAIASIAFGQEEPVVDGNVARVLGRVMALDAPASAPSSQRALWSLATDLARGPRPGDLNQALMELGATLCTPLAPACARCPLTRSCEARATGAPELFPRGEGPTTKQDLDVAFAFARSRKGVWLEQRPLTGLWAGLWELPSAEGPNASSALAARLRRDLGPVVAEVTHELTHRHVLARIYVVRSPLTWRASRTRRTFDAPLDAPISGLARKAIRAIAAAIDGDGTTEKNPHRIRGDER